MSATNRGERGGGGLDFFATPSWCVRALFPVLDQFLWTDYQRAFFDPSCGDGAILATLAEHWPTVRREGIEIDEGRSDEALLAGAAHAAVLGDALARDWVIPSNPDAQRIVVGNPPYALAEQFVRKAIEQIDAGNVRQCFFLMRLGFLAGEDRCAWLRHRYPSAYVLPARPDYTGEGGDSADYAWLNWGPKPDAFPPRASATLAVLDLANSGREQWLADTAEQRREARARARARKEARDRKKLEEAIAKRDALARYP